MIKIRCRVCGVEVHGSGTCGCPNMASINNDKVTAVDLNKIIMIQSNSDIEKKNHLSNTDLMWQEERKRRKFRKLEFEIR